MIITCEECNTNYTLPDGSITGIGRMVKCAKCGNVWHQSPFTKKIQIKAQSNFEKKRLEQAQQKAKSAAKTQELPAVIEVEINPLLYILYVLPGFFIILSFIFIFIYSKPFMINNLSLTNPLYEAFNGFSVKGVMFRDVTLTKIPSGQGFDLFVKGKIINNSREMRNMPDVRISLTDEDKNVVASHVILYAEKFIEPKSSINVSNMVTNLPPTVKYIILDLGSPMDLAIR